MAERGIATVADLRKMLEQFQADAPVAIEDGEFGPLLCIDGLTVSWQDARLPDYTNWEVKRAVTISHRRMRERS